MKWSWSNLAWGGHWQARIEDNHRAHRHMEAQP